MRKREREREMMAGEGHGAASAAGRHGGLARDELDLSAVERRGGLAQAAAMAELKGKGKGPAVAVASPASAKKKGDGLGGKVQLLHYSKQKPAAVASVSKSAEVKGKASVSSSARTITKITRKKKKITTARVKAVKKVYSLPGQKHDPPEEREPLRIFYESLSKQIPSSEMAEFWMMEHGLLTADKAKRAYARKQKRQQQPRTGTPVKTSHSERPQSTKKPQLSKNADSKASKRVNYSDDDDDDGDDFIVKLKKAKV